MVRPCRALDTTPRRGQATGQLEGMKHRSIRLSTMPADGSSDIHKSLTRPSPIGYNGVAFDVKSHIRAQSRDTPEAGPG